jgi:tetratricopeptide (TPR) repeat protein
MAIDSINKVARAHRSRFPERVRFMFEDARWSGDRVRAFGWAQASAVRFPTDADAAFYLADAYFHYGLNLGEPRERAVAAFQRALALDDQDPELLSHFEVLMMEAGDSAASKAAFERCHAIAPRVCDNDLAFRALFRREDPRMLAVGPDSLFWGGLAHRVLRVAPWDPAYGLAITDSFAQIQTGPSRSASLRNGAYVVRSNVALARGQHELAWSFLDSAAAVANPRAGFHMLHHIVTGTHEPEATAATVNPTNFTSVVIRAWWAAARQAPDSAEKYARMLETTWPEDQSINVGQVTVAPPGMATALATGLRGLVALRLGDTVKALDLLTRARNNNGRATFPLRILIPSAELALVHAQIEAARGNATKARLYLVDVYPMNAYVPFIGDAEELRATVALALADTTAAKTHLKNVIAVWDRADPPLQPRVAVARATLARLENR